jgi:phage terminase large subunit
MKKVKLTPEQKAYIKGLEKSKHRKAQKLQFRLQNAFEQTKLTSEDMLEISKRLSERIRETEDKPKIVMTTNPLCNSTWVYDAYIEYTLINKKHNK